jgi:membrane protease YdiL (CAAX protease family)
VILFVVWYVFEASLDRLLRAMGVRSGPTRWDAFFRQPGVATVFSITAFVAAAYEEVVFRAYLISRLSRTFGERTWWAVLASAVLFAFLHRYPLRPALLVLAYGAFCGVVYARSRSLPRLVVAHWLFNIEVMRHYLRGT